MGAASAEVEPILDGPWSSYTCRRVAVMVILAGCWFQAFESFVDVFVARRVDAASCTCTAASWVHNTSTLDAACAACEAALGSLECSDRSTLAGEFGLYCSKEWLRSLPLTLYSVGVGIGSFAGILADRYGRRPVLVAARTGTAVVFLASALAPSFNLYLAAKLLVGLTSQSGGAAGFPLATELCGKRLRARLTAELWTHSWATSCCVLALIAYLLCEHSWRWLAFASGIPYVVLACCYALFVPESPRWCICHGQRDRAYAILARLVKGNGRLLQSGATSESSGGDDGGGSLIRAAEPSNASGVDGYCSSNELMVDDRTRPCTSTDMVSAPSASGVAGDLMDRVPPTTAVDHSANERAPPSSSVLELCSTSPMSRYTFIEAYLWMTVSLSYFAIGTRQPVWIERKSYTDAHSTPKPELTAFRPMLACTPGYNSGNLVGDPYLNFLIISLPLYGSAFAASFLPDHPKIGRRGAGAIFYGAITLAIGAGALWPHYATYSSIIGSWAGEAAFSVVYLQTMELCPTRLRGSMFAVCSAAGRVGSTVAAPIVTICGETITLATIAAMCLGALLSSFGLPETLGKAMNES